MNLVEFKARTKEYFENIIGGLDVGTEQKQKKHQLCTGMPFSSQLFQPTDEINGIEDIKS